MYQIKCINGNDEIPILELRDADLVSAEANIDEGINRAGSLTFTIPVVHPNYDKIKKLESEIVVVDLNGDVEIFRGRYISEETDFYNTKKCVCEGTMSYLLDTKYDPYLYTGSVSGFMRELLDEHNSKVRDKQKVYIGNIEVIDPNDYFRRESKDYESTMSIIQDKIVRTYSGLLQVRRTNGKNYMDYLKDYPVSDQVVRFGENIIDLSKYSKAESVRTVIIPLGAEDEESGKRLKIGGVNGGVDYLANWDLVEQYGWIEDTVEFDDVTLPENLKTKGQQYLDDCKNMSLTVELTAVDCRLLGMDVRRVKPGMLVSVVSPPHGLDAMFLCTSKTTNLLSPDKDKIVLGNEFVTYTESANREKKEFKNKVENANKSLAQKIQDAKDDFAEAMKNGKGLYSTAVKQEDGSTVYILHDKAKLTDSDIQIMVNATGIGVSADGGVNWYGMQVNGDMIANILSAEGINANWINVGVVNAALVKAGALSSKDGNSFWNMDTGEMQLSGIFRQFAKNGQKSIDILGNVMNVYSWSDSGNYVGSVGALTNTTDSSEVSIGIWHDIGDSIKFGHKREDGKIVPAIIMKDDGNPPWIEHTWSGSFIGGNPAGSQIITVRNGLITDKKDR